MTTGEGSEGLEVCSNPVHCDAPRLLQRVPQCLSVTPDTIIAGDDGDELRRLADLRRCGEMNCIERADGLDWVGAPRPHQD